MAVLAYYLEIEERARRVPSFRCGEEKRTFFFNTFNAIFLLNVSAYITLIKKKKKEKLVYIENVPNSVLSSLHLLNN